MNHILTIPADQAAAATRLLLRGTARVEQSLTILPGPGGFLTALARASTPAAGESVLRIVALPPELGVSALPPGLGEEVRGVLALGLDAAVRGRAIAWLRDETGLFDRRVRLRLPGPGMAEIPPPGEEFPRLSAVDQARWSRTAAVLGDPALETMSRLSVGLVGLGRLGSGLLEYLVSLPIARVVLIDGDRVEPHNGGEGGHYSPHEAGQQKVEVWKIRLAFRHPEIEVETHACSVTEGVAMDALAGCDVIFSAPDNPGARLSAAAVAVAYHIPLVDVGTGIHRESLASGEAMGADVRLVAPGRCLPCFGGVASLADGRRILASPDYEESFSSHRDWRAERRGSLHSLNLLAVSLAARMWEDFVSASLIAPAWWHASIGQDGVPSLSSLSPAGPPSRCVCRLAGLGNGAYRQFVSLLG